MGNVTELRVALTVEDFDRAVAFYRDALGLEQLADWSSATGRVVVLEAGRATLELFDAAQAESVDAIEAGRRVSGPVRLALRVADSGDMAERLVAAGAEAVGLLARFLFEQRGHHRITIDPAAANEPAIRCYAKVGFRPVGVMRQYERGGDGRFHDGLLMDLLRDELAPGR